MAIRSNTVGGKQMKKWLISIHIILFIILSVMFTAQSTVVIADEVNSRVQTETEGVISFFEENVRSSVPSIQQTPEKPLGSLRLPSTGEMILGSLVALGISMIMLILLFIIKRMRKGRRCS